MQTNKKFSHYRENIIKSELQKNSDSVKKSLKREYGLGQILGKSKAVNYIHEKIDKVSLCDVNVLINGESGTGKELVARAIHYLSKRASKPFIPVNCSAIPENLFENELFGHAKGAFTDAYLPQTGLVKEAEGGTLFLDEVGSIRPYIQAKLLRFLQEKVYKPLGDPRSHKAELRIISATNKCLKDLMQEGRFREDLYFRLNVVSIHIPPLRERKEDIPILVMHFIEKFSRQFNKPVKEISNSAIQAFLSYSWPGNIRELENIIQEIVVMSASPVIKAEDVCIRSDIPSLEEPKIENLKVAKKKYLEKFEKAYLLRLLREHRGNVVSAAFQSGKSRTGLWNLLKKYNLSPKQFRF